MPDDQKYFDIGRPTNPAPPVPPSTQPAHHIPVMSSPVDSTVPAEAMAEEPKPQITSIPVSQAPAQPVAQTAPAIEPDAGRVAPALPGAPPNNIPNFGDMQPKVDAHPLFSGQTQQPVKIRRRVSRRLMVYVSGLAVIAILALWFINSSAGASYLPFHFLKAKNDLKPVATNVKINSAPVVTPKVSSSPSIYNGWDTKCVNALKACIKVPSGWISNPYGGYENTAKTQYAELAVENVKDNSSADALIVSIDELATPNSSLKVVGLIFGSKPTYAIYDTNYISANQLKVGATKNILIGNYTFTGPTGQASLVGTPDDNGIKAITSISQARAWFATTDAQQVLKVVRSFYYQ